MDINNLNRDELLELKETIDNRINEFEEKELIKRLVDKGVNCVKIYSKDGEELETF